MLFLNINRSILLYFYLIFTLSSVVSKRFPIKNSRLLKPVSTNHRQLATYCYIDDYPAWLQRRHEFMMWLEVAKMLRLPIYEDEQFQHELKQYRLQYECLRAVERLPISFGPG
jgi:hypothetical protein